MPKANNRVSVLSSNLSRCPRCVIDKQLVTAIAALQRRVSLAAAHTHVLAILSIATSCTVIKMADVEMTDAAAAVPKTKKVAAESDGKKRFEVKKVGPGARETCHTGRMTLTRRSGTQSPSGLGIS